MDIESVWHDKYAHRAGEGKKLKGRNRLQIISGYAAFYKEHEKYGVSLDGCAGGYSTYDR